MALKNKIILVRTALRAEHRDVKGDDRCWIDDYSIWKFSRSRPILVKPTPVEAMRRCILFYHLRRAEFPDPIPSDAILERSRWDEDLEGICRYQLSDKLEQTVNFIEHHYQTSRIRPLQLRDDRLLYEVLPEKIPADFRLPSEEEFLGRAKHGAGCPNFWDSHADCGRNCNLHQWGPC